MAASRHQSLGAAALIRRLPAVDATQGDQIIEFVRPRDEDEPDENPILYEFNETLGGGGSVLEYIENRAVPRWVRATRQALEACIASGAAKPPDNSR